MRLCSSPSLMACHRLPQGPHADSMPVPSAEGPSGVAALIAYHAAVIASLTRDGPQHAPGPVSPDGSASPASFQDDCESFSSRVVTAAVRGFQSPAAAVVPAAHPIFGHSASKRAAFAAPRRRSSRPSGVVHELDGDIVDESLEMNIKTDDFLVLNIVIVDYEQATSGDTIAPASPPGCASVSLSLCMGGRFTPALLPGGASAAVSHWAPFRPADGRALDYAQPPGTASPAATGQPGAVLGARVTTLCSLLYVGYPMSHKLPWIISIHR